MPQIRNIIFDFGGVLINLDAAATLRAMKALLGERYEAYHQGLKTTGIYRAFEVGAIGEAAFLEHFVAHQPPLSAEMVKAAWNAMLLDIPEHRLALLRRLRAQGFGVFLLSNTNETHIRFIDRYLLETYQIQDFRAAFFDKGYYSFELKMRKPDAEIYAFVLADAGLNAAETLFIDDNADNAAGAEALGIRTICHDPAQEVGAVLDAYLAAQ